MSIGRAGAPRNRYDEGVRTRCLVAAAAWLAACAAPTPVIFAEPFEIARLPLDATIGSLALSPEPGSLFATDLDGGRVVRISTRDGELKAEAAVGEARAMAVHPEGRRVYLAGPAKEGGRYFVLKPHELEVESTFVMAFKPHSLAADARGRLYVSSADAPGRVAVIDPKERKIVTMWEAPSAEAAIALTPSGRTLLAASRGRSPGVLMALPLHDDSLDPVLLESEGFGGRFFLCDRGRRIVFASGSVVEFDEAAFRFTAGPAVGPILGAAGDPERPRLLAARPDGSVALLQLDPPGVLALSKPSSTLATELAFDSARSLLFAAGGDASTLGIVDGAPRVRGDLRFLDISAWSR